MARKSRKGIEAAPMPVETPVAVCKAAGYIRLSVEDNHKKGDSVETQKAILQNYIATATDITLHDFYLDNGTTGTNFERPAFRRMLADAESGVINCIIVKDLSRLGRNAIDTGYYIEKYLPSIGVRFIAVNDDFDTNCDMDNGAGIMLPLKNVINEAYALDISRKIKAQQRQAMKSGEYIGARPPYGYVKDPNNCHKLIVDSVAAPVVRQIYEWLIANVSVNDIVRRLNEAGITTPSHYRREQGLIKHENLIGKGLWQTFTVNKILTDEVYVGDMVQGKSKSTCRRQSDVPKSEWIRVPNTHEPIISREMFAEAGRRLQQLADNVAARVKTPYTLNIFKGKVFCGHCGGSLHRQRGWKHKGVDVYVFHCLANSRKARGSCESFMMPENELIRTLLTAIQKHADAIIGKSLKLRKNTAAVEVGRDAAKAELAALRMDADKNGRMLKSLYESLVSGLITADEYRDMRAGYEAKSRDNKDRAAALENRQRELEKQIAEYCELSALIENAGTGGVTAELVDRLIGGIRIFSDRRIEVDFRFDSGFDLIDEVTAHEQ